MTKELYLRRVFAQESNFTADTNMYISHNYESLRGFYYHIPNESSTSDMMRLKLAAMGVLPGVPDFHFDLPHSWYLELKMPGKDLSPSQKKLHPKWKERGIIIHTAWTTQEVCDILEPIYGGPKYGK